MSLPHSSTIGIEGVGMTSRRTRDRLIARLREQGIQNEAVLAAISQTPRHIFVDEALAHRAYEDTALPIGFGQTLSQPYIVAKMTELLCRHARSLDRVLEIGTGSGYQTAILAGFTNKLYSVERIKPLQAKARSRLRLLKINNVTLQHADGGLGFAKQAPFDAILSAAAPEKIPQSLKDQLAPGGVLITPVGGAKQRLHLVRRDEANEFTTEDLEDVYFVPLLGGTTR